VVGSLENANSAASMTGVNDRIYFCRGGSTYGFLYLFANVSKPRFLYTEVDGAVV